MGNAESEPEQPASNAMKLFHDYEHKNGKLLVAAIKSNSLVGMDKALEVARKEFARPKTTGFNKAQYEDMVVKVLEYLTQKYDIGDGILCKQTPTEWAKTSNATAALEWIRTKIEYFEKLKSSGLVVDDGSTNTGGGDNNSSTSNTGVSEASERAALAKERLKAFQNKR